MYRKILLYLIFCCASIPDGIAQQIRGLIQDRESKQGLANAQILNVYDNSTAYTDSTGHFTINARKGELVEVRCAGYNKVSVRLTNGDLPQFFKLYLDKVTILNTDRFASSGLTPFQIDSIKNHELYKNVLEYRRLSTFQMVESPFTAAADKKKWDFQDSYALFEQEKYIDYMFNEALVKQITGLEGTDLQRYMKLYRPSYEALRSLTQYDYYSYIRTSAERYRRNRPATPRNAN